MIDHMYVDNVLLFWNRIFTSTVNNFVKMIIDDGVLSVICFSAPLLTLILIVFQYVGLELTVLELEPYIWWIILGYFVFVHLILRIALRGYAYQVGVRAAVLGCLFALGMFVAFMLPQSWNVFGWYMCVMSFFHYSEFLTIAVTNPSTLSIDSFILNHSYEYYFAAIASWIEFIIERYFYPEMKLLRPISYIGLFMCIGGETLRKIAMFTAKSNFTHIVQSQHKEGHVLITHGIYSIFRHPSYVGWFYWALGTQVILINPVCVVAYLVASWKFFRDRVLVEELTLLKFFGEDYIHYQEKVPTGLPCIKGYKMDL